MPFVTQIRHIFENHKYIVVKIFASIDITCYWLYDLHSIATIPRGAPCSHFLLPSSLI